MSLIIVVNADKIQDVIPLPLEFRNRDIEVSISLPAQKNSMSGSFAVTADLQRMRSIGRSER